MFLQAYYPLSYVSSCISSWLRPLACSLQFVLWCVCIRMSVGSLVGELTTDVNSTVEHLRELGEMALFPGPTRFFIATAMMRKAIAMKAGWGLGTQLG